MGVTIVEQSAGRATFRVSSIELEYVVPSARPKGHFLEENKDYAKLGCESILQETPWNKGDFVANNNGFVHAVMTAYNRHHALVIRPDDVWLAIMSQFGLYVNANAEAMRDIFVSHEGKKGLVVENPDDYADFAKIMAGLLRSNVKDASLCDWVVPEFTTTTDNDTIVGSVVLMATLKAYFKYVCCFDCGIPSVTILGTVDDWERLHRRVDALAKYGDECTKWCSMLKKITGQMVESRKGKVDEDFWSRVCKYERYGSGGPYNLTGWLAAFCAFNSEGKWMGHGCGRDWPSVSTVNIPDGYLTVDVHVNDNGYEFDTVLFAGHLGYDIVEYGKGVAPKLAWAIVKCDKGKAQPRDEVKADWDEFSF